VSWEAGCLGSSPKGPSGGQTKSGASGSGSERLVAGQHVPDRFGQAPRDVDLRDLRAALLSEPALVALVALAVGVVAERVLNIAEIGDIDRFPTARDLCSWAGLTPTVRSSDGKARLGHISRQGSPALRWALVEGSAEDHHRLGAAPRAAKRIAERSRVLSHDT
jgi:hypothetical protein